jgi:hypothetical protein
MKRNTYPSFQAHCLVGVYLAGNFSKAAIKLQVSMYIHHWDDARRGAISKAKETLASLGVTDETLQGAEFEEDEVEYLAIDPKGVRKSLEKVSAHYLHAAKDRDRLIRQRRLVPDSATEMREIYGTAKKKEVAA